MTYHVPHILLCLASFGAGVLFTFGIGALAAANAHLDRMFDERTPAVPDKLEPIDDAEVSA